MNNSVDKNKLENLLPMDGEVYYFGQILTYEEAAHYCAKLLEEIPWEFDRAIIFGKSITTKRKTAWYGNKPFLYTYSKITRQALPWSHRLLALKQLIEVRSGQTFNSCLMNLYPTGAEGMAWHSDGEKDLQKNGAIASLSFGAERKFSFKHKKTKEIISISLEAGSLLVMKGATQTYWWHRLPPTKKILEPRINLTFRNIVLQSP